FFFFYGVLAVVDIFATEFGLSVWDASGISMRLVLDPVFGLCRCVAAKGWCVVGDWSGVDSR
ncbi:hypothetical protein, partial [Escherichia coli]|uniref:hypothetical protein n=1 Tax=Escherichia coli TaxID=562 RepID=UPI001BAE57CB